MRSKRWEVPFESFNGVSCRIDIYAEGWVGGITELSTDNPSAPGVPSSNPFYYEEDRSQDVLTPIRSSTGYIGLAEYVSGGLNDLIPQNMFDRYVEVYYGYTLVWVGYIQQKEFSSQFGGNPLVREFPVISPLGLVDEVFFPEYDPPAPISFKDLMKAVATQLNVSYSNVVMPMSGPGLDASMSSLTVCPFNDEHTFAKYNEESVVAPKPLRFFLEGLCNLYGWTLREVGLSMVFTAFNYEGQYMQYAFTPVGMSNRSSIGYYGNSENDIENQFYYADNNAALTAIDAAKSVTYEYDGNTKFEEEHDFNLDTYAASEGIFNPAVYLLPYSQSFGSRYFQLSDSPGVSIVLDNEAKGSINYKYDSSHTVGALLWQGFLKNHNSLGLLYLHLSWDGNEELTNDIELSLQITTAETKDSQPEYYLNRNVANYSWSSSGTQFTVTIDKVTGEIKPDSSQFTSYIPIPATPTPFQNIFVTVFTTANSQLGQRANYKIEMKMTYSFQYTEDGHTYTGDLIFALFPDKFKKVVSLNDEGQEYTLHQNFSDKMMAVEKISPDYDVALISPIVLSETQERLEAKFRMINEYSLVTPETYIEKQEFWQSGWRWRVVSVRFDLRDDEYLVTMHRSPTLESGPSPVPPTPIDYSTKYLTFEALEAGTFTLTIPAAITTTEVISVSYSTDDGATWVTTNNSSSAITITTPTIAAGSKVLWKGTAVRYGTSTSNRCTFSSTGNCNLSGNIMSMLYGDSFQDKTTYSEAYTFISFFRENSKLLSAENLVLPKTTTTNCYRTMFYQCTNLTTSPVIPADKLIAGSCYGMFSGCSSLNYITCLATNISANNCTNGWVNNVAATGTFVKAASMSSWTTGTSGIPSGWTVEDES